MAGEGTFMMSSVQRICTMIRMLTAMVRNRPVPRTRALVLIRRVRWVAWALVAGVLLYKLFGESAHAITLFNDIENQMENQSGGLFGSVLGMATRTFWLLAVIELCWAAAIWAFERDNLSSLAMEMIKKIMFIGFFYALLLNGQTWIPSIVAGFQQVGESQGGVTLSTDGILTQGIQTMATLWAATVTASKALEFAPEEADGFGIPGVDAAHDYGMEGADFTILVALLVVASYTIVAAQYFMIKAESTILLAAGAIFLGLGSSSWTKDYAQKYINYAITVGVRLLVLTLILSYTMNVINKLGGPGVTIFTGPVGVLEIAGATLLQALLAMKAPELASTLLAGGGGAALSAGSIANAAQQAYSNLNMVKSAGASVAAGGASPLQQLSGQTGRGAGGGAGGGGGGTSSVSAAANAGLGGMTGMGAAGGGAAGGRAGMAATLGGLAGRPVGSATGDGGAGGNTGLTAASRGGTGQMGLGGRAGGLPGPGGGATPLAPGGGNPSAAGGSLGGSRAPGAGASPAVGDNIAGAGGVLRGDNPPSGGGPLSGANAPGASSPVGAQPAARQPGLSGGGRGAGSELDAGSEAGSNVGDERALPAPPYSELPDEGEVSVDERPPPVYSGHL
jgi:type IV secretion system protein TrbL